MRCATFQEFEESGSSAETGVDLVAGTRWWRCQRQIGDFQCQELRRQETTGLWRSKIRHQLLNTIKIDTNLMYNLFIVHVHGI